MTSLLETFKQDKTRVVFRLNSIDTTDTNILIKEISKHIGFDLSKYQVQICHKVHTSGYYLNWHMDDCYVYKHSCPPRYGNFIQLSEKHYLTFTKRPVYTCIIYLSDYNIDFSGGVFEFNDGNKIYPFKNLCVFFGRDQVHRVTLLKAGTRKSILIKFYDEP